MSGLDLESIIESMLVVSNEPLPVDRIAEVILEEDPEVPREHIVAAIDRLITTYAERSRPFGRGMRIEEVAGGIQLRTPPENAPFLQRLLSARPQRLTRAALETLAIIAYRQPITKPDVEAIRGVDIAAVLKALLDRELVRIVGKKEEVGRPILYGTTPKFLELFGLRSLAALPSLREYHELDAESQKELDELHEDTTEKRISALASTARFLVERTNDPGLEELDRAVLSVHEADLRTRRSLGDQIDPHPDDAEAKGAPASKAKRDADDGRFEGKRTTNDEAAEVGAQVDARTFEARPASDQADDSFVQALAGGEGLSPEGEGLAAESEAKEALPQASASVTAPIEHQVETVAPRPKKPRAPRGAAKSSRPKRAPKSEAPSPADETTEDEHRRAGDGEASARATDREEPDRSPSEGPPPSAETPSSEDTLPMEAVDASVPDSARLAPTAGEAASSHADIDVPGIIQSPGELEGETEIDRSTSQLPLPNEVPSPKVRERPRWSPRGDVAKNLGTKPDDGKKNE